MEQPPPEFGKHFRSSVDEADWPRATSAIAANAQHCLTECHRDTAVEVAFLAYLRNAPLPLQAVFASAISSCGPTDRWRDQLRARLLSTHIATGSDALERHDLAGLFRAWERMMEIPPSVVDRRKLRAVAARAARYVGDIESASVCAVYADQANNVLQPAPNGLDIEAVLGPMYRGLGTLVMRLAASAAASGHHDRLPGEIVLMGFRHCGWPTWRSFTELMAGHPEVLLEVAPQVRRRHREGCAARRHFEFVVARKTFPELPPAFADQNGDDVLF